MKFLKKHWILEIIVFGLSLVLFLYKLDYYYFFTDEILYVQCGVEHLKGIYDDTLQVAPLPKLFAGLLFFLFNNHVYMLRLPYALMGIISSFIIYLILKREFNSHFGLLGVFLFITSRIIFDSTRMVMLEPMMHLFWLLFLYYYYETFFIDRTKVYVFSGIFLGLALLAKITSIVFIPFIVLGFCYQIYKKQNIGALIKYYALMLGSTLAIIFIGYLHFFIKSGIIAASIATLKAIKNTYFLRNNDGKYHVIGNTIYLQSPWWTYIYYHLKLNGIVRTLVYVILVFISLTKNSFFTIYWGVFLLITIVFNQALGIKNYRYISSMEIPLIILAIAGLHYIYHRVKPGKYIKAFVIIIILFMLGSQIIYLKNLKHTEYLGLYNYFKKETANFSLYKRLYAYGSVRSMKWYRGQVPDENMFIYRKDYNIMCPELWSFDYFAFDKEELLKDQDNFLYKYVSENINHFQKVDEIEDMIIYKKIEQFDSKIECPKIAP